jgi:putative endopeptidase
MRSYSRHLATAAICACLVPAANAALDVAGLDASIDACTSFYQYANNTWLAATKIPADRARLGTTDIIGQRNEKILLDALEAERGRTDTHRKYAPGTPEWMAIEYFRSGMFTNRIEYYNYVALFPLIDRANAVASPNDIAAALGYLHENGVAAGFSYSVDPDRKDSNRYQLDLQQGGLGLPDRDYYFLEDERSKSLREGYRAHVTRMFQLLGDKPELAATNAASVIALETELARVSMTATERRDVDKTYNRRTLAELAAETPGFPWETYLDALKARNVPDVNVSQPEFFKALAKLVNDKSYDWKSYLRWQVATAAADKMPKRFDDENFDFFERQFKGVKAPPPRARKVLKIMGGPYGEKGLGMALGKIYVDAAFPPEAKKRALDLVTNVRAAPSPAPRSAPSTSSRTGSPPTTSTTSATWAASASRSTARIGSSRRTSSTRTTSRPITRSCFPPASCSRPTSTPRPTTRSTTAASAW